MRNESGHSNDGPRLARVLFAAVAMASLGIVSAVRADDPAPASAPAPKPDASKPNTKAPAKPATTPAAKPADAGDDESGDYEKNAAKRFTPTERTPADRNVSFPVDI